MCLCICMFIYESHFVRFVCVYDCLCALNECVFVCYIRLFVCVKVRCVIIVYGVCSPFSIYIMFCVPT